MGGHGIAHTPLPGGLPQQAVRETPGRPAMTSGPVTASGGGPATASAVAPAMP